MDLDISYTTLQDFIDIDKPEQRVSMENPESGKISPKMMNIIYKVFKSYLNRVFLIKAAR